MPVKHIQAPWRHRVFKDDSILTTMLAEGELAIDLRGDTPAARLGDGLTLGGHIFAAESLLGSVRRPVIESPSSGSTVAALSPIITASAYSAIGIDGGPDAHASSRWVIYSDAGLTTIVYDSGYDAIALTDIDLLSKAVTLPSTTTLYVVVSYRSDGGLETTSEAASFNTP